MPSYESFFSVLFAATRDLYCFLPGFLLASFFASKQFCAAPSLQKRAKASYCIQILQPPMFRHLVLTTIFLLGISSIVIAHGHDEGMSMAEPEMGRPTLAVTANVTVEPTYFTCDEHSGLMMAHILLMIVAWVFVLPISQ